MRLILRLSEDFGKFVTLPESLHTSLPQRHRFTFNRHYNAPSRLSNSETFSYDHRTEQGRVKARKMGCVVPRVAYGVLSLLTRSFSYRNVVSALSRTPESISSSPAVAQSELPSLSSLGERQTGFSRLRSLLARRCPCLRADYAGLLSGYLITFSAEDDQVIKLSDRLPARRARGKTHLVAFTPLLSFLSPQVYSSPSTTSNPSSAGLCSDAGGGLPRGRSRRRGRRSRDSLRRNSGRFRSLGGGDVDR